MVPMGRFELPRIAPYAPQAHVSTSSTTSALTYCDFPSSALSGTGDAGLVAAGVSESGIIERDFSFEDIVAKVREVIMNNVAMAVVILVKKLLAPELPNIV